ncbi:MAG: hypothetical protein JOZ73_01490 [Solirubrobacterales bacterium]|nr:hypothetical protein [Solirubrobacterales bacterium]
MNAFEVVTLVVSVVAIALAATSYFQLHKVLQQLGRGGTTWFDRAEDSDVAERPNEDDRDEPIPRRPLRGRPE